MVLGVLLAHFNDSFQRDLWKSVRTRARQWRASTVAFLGHGLEEPQLRHRTSTALYQLARGPLLEGLVVFSQNVGTHSGPEAVARLVDDLGLPTVSVGYHLPGVPSVRSVSDRAVHELVEHLVTVHGRRHFALITGPSLQPESVDRERSVRAALADHGLTIAPELVIDAQFSREAAAKMADALFAPGVTIDAVVCLNDHMAVGVLDALRHRRIPVPEAVSVVGFDDLPESRWRRPPLTTVQQPLAAMGSRAVDLLLEERRNHLLAPALYECTTVFRRSCGCPMPPRAVSESDVEEGLNQSDRFAWLREVGVSLQGAFDWDSLASQWALALETLGFQAGVVVLYHGPLHHVIRWSQAEGLRRSDELEVSLPLPGREERTPADWIVLPLVYQDEFLGYLVLTCDLEDTIVYETLRDQMSTAVKATALMEASFHHQRELERQVERRTKELRTANRNLTEEIRHRRQLEQVVQEVSNQTMQAIGQDIHDDLCQHLAGIGMLASVLEERWQDEAVDVRPLQEIRTLLDKAVDRARQYSRTLYPPGLEQHGLVAALGDLVENFRQTAPHLEVALQVEGACFTFDSRVRLQLYRIAQELVANAVKHSGSELILVRLIDEPEGWCLEVRDFGKGMALPPPSDRMGMQILQFRADSVGASMLFQNLDPGLRVSCRVPKPLGGAA